MIAPLQPGLFLAVLLGTLYGALGHLLFGRHWLRLPFFLLGGIGGCIFVWLIGIRILPRFPAPGGLPLLESSVMAWLLLLLIAAWRRA
jgi:hypothetical protein